MQEYVVTWECSISADSPEAAARLARAWQRSPHARVGCFEVIDEAGETALVDLDELDERAALRALGERSGA